MCALSRPSPLSTQSPQLEPWNYTMHSGARKTFQPPSPGHSDTWREHWTSRTDNASPRQVSHAASPRQVLWHHAASRHLKCAQCVCLHRPDIPTQMVHLARVLLVLHQSQLALDCAIIEALLPLRKLSRLSFCVPVVIDILTGCLLHRALDNGINAFSDPAAMASFGMPRPPARRRSGRPSPTHGGNILSQSATGWYHSGDCRCHSCHQLWPSKITWPIKE